MSGLDHLTFGEFVESLAHSPAKVAGVPQVVGDKAAAPPVEADGAAVPLMAAVKAAAHPGMPRLVCKLEDPPMRSVRAAGMSPVNSSPVVTESAPEPAPPLWPTSLLDIFLFSVCGASGIRSLKGGLCHGPAGVPRLATRCLCVLSIWLVCWCHVLPCRLSVPSHLVT